MKRQLDIKSLKGRERERQTDKQRERSLNEERRQKKSRH
jgi:hypothetical protein